MRVQMTSMDSPIDETLFVTMVIENFCNRANSQRGCAISALVTISYLTWKSTDCQVRYLFVTCIGPFAAGVCFTAVLKGAMS